MFHVFRSHSSVNGRPVPLRPAPAQAPPHRIRRVCGRRDQRRRHGHLINSTWNRVYCVLVEGGEQDGEVIAGTLRIMGTGGARFHWPCSSARTLSLARSLTCACHTSLEHHAAGDLRLHVQPHRENSRTHGSDDSPSTPPHPPARSDPCYVGGVGTFLIYPPHSYPLPRPPATSFPLLFQPVGLTPEHGGFFFSFFPPLSSIPRPLASFFLLQSAPPSLSRSLSSRCWRYLHVFFTSF